MIVELISSLIVVAIGGLAGWIYTIGNRVTRNEARIETLKEKVDELNGESSALKTSLFGMDARIDKRVNEATIEMTKFLHELQLTLKELNSTVGYLKEELRELKKK